MEKVVVVGAGLMGSGIAHAFAVGGARVILVDTSADVLAKAEAGIASLIDAGIKLGKVGEAAGNAALSNLTTRGALDESMGDAVLLMETATENMDVKRSIIRRADQLLRDKAVIATNTSALSISEIAASTRRPQHVIGMHFFNPVHKMKLVEIIRGVETSARRGRPTLGHGHRQDQHSRQRVPRLHDEPHFGDAGKRGDVHVVRGCRQRGGYRHRIAPGVQPSNGSPGAR
jgi:3-hydroxyacyl-CoA dehydrogenase